MVIAFGVIAGVEEHTRADAAINHAVANPWPFQSSEEISVFFVSAANSSSLTTHLLRNVDFHSLTFYADIARELCTERYTQLAAWPHDYADSCAAEHIPMELHDFLFHLGAAVEKKRPIGVSLSHQGIRNGMSRVFKGRRCVHTWRRN